MDTVGDVENIRVSVAFSTMTERKHADRTLAIGVCIL
jgi:hypothetical protein